MVVLRIEIIHVETSICLGIRIQFWFMELEWCICVYDTKINDDFLDEHI